MVSKIAFAWWAGKSVAFLAGCGWAFAKVFRIGQPIAMPQGIPMLHPFWDDHAAVQDLVVALVRANEASSFQTKVIAFVGALNRFAQACCMPPSSVTDVSVCVAAHLEVWDELHAIFDAMALPVQVIIEDCMVALPVVAEWRDRARELHFAMQDALINASNDEATAQVADSCNTGVVDNIWDPHRWEIEEDQRLPQSMFTVN